MDKEKILLGVVYVGSRSAAAVGEIGGIRGSGREICELGEYFFWEKVWEGGCM